MKKNQVIEAWRNEEYYLNLSEEERAALPEHPAGPASIEDEMLRSITGGCGTLATSAMCSPCPPWHCY